MHKKTALVATCLVIFGAASVSAANIPARAELDDAQYNDYAKDALINVNERSVGKHRKLHHKHHHHKKHRFMRPPLYDTHLEAVPLITDIISTPIPTTSTSTIPTTTVTNTSITTLTSVTTATTTLTTSDSSVVTTTATSSVTTPPALSVGVIFEVSGTLTNDVVTGQSFVRAQRAVDKVSTYLTLILAVLPVGTQMVIAAPTVYGTVFISSTQTSPVTYISVYTDPVSAGILQNSLKTNAALFTGFGTLGVQILANGQATSISTSCPTGQSLVNGACEGCVTAPNCLASGSTCDPANPFGSTCKNGSCVPGFYSDPTGSACAACMPAPNCTAISICTNGSSSTCSS